MNLTKQFWPTVKSWHETSSDPVRRQIFSDVPDVIRCSASFKRQIDKVSACALAAFSHRSALLIQRYSIWKAFLSSLCVVKDGRLPLACDADRCLSHHRKDWPAKLLEPTISKHFAFQPFLWQSFLKSLWLKSFIHMILLWHGELQHDNVLCCLWHQNDVRSESCLGNMLRQLKLPAQVHCQLSVLCSEKPWCCLRCYFWPWAPVHATSDTGLPRFVMSSRVPILW